MVGDTGVIGNRRRPQSPQPNPEAPREECWFLGCSDEAIALVGGLGFPYIDPKARVCETHDLAYFEPDTELTALDYWKLSKMMAPPDWADTNKRPRWWRTEF